MKKVFKKIIQFYLKILSKIALIRHKPEIIAIAGSTGKHAVKEGIDKILSGKFSIRIGPKKYNAEIGVPLTIFGLVSDSSKIRVWLPLIIKVTKTAFFTKHFPKKIILELGVSHPNDVDYFLSIIKPKITILTNINAQYFDNFGDLDLLANEYAKLVKATNKDGLVVLNNDDLRIRKLKIFSDARVVRYGLGEGSDFRAVDMSSDDNKQKFTAKFNEYEKEFSLNKFGVHHVYAKLIGLAIKKYYNI